MRLEAPNLCHLRWVRYVLSLFLVLAKERSCKALSKKSRPRATAAVGVLLDWTHRLSQPAVPDGLRDLSLDFNMMTTIVRTEGVDGLCFEGIALEAEARFCWTSCANHPSMILEMDDREVIVPMSCITGHSAGIHA